MVLVIDAAAVAGPVTIVNENKRLFLCSVTGWHSYCNCQWSHFCESLGRVCSLTQSLGYSKTYSKFVPIIVTHVRKKQVVVAVQDFSKQGNETWFHYYKPACKRMMWPNSDSSRNLTEIDVYCILKPEGSDTDRVYAQQPYYQCIISADVYRDTLTIEE